MALLATNIFTDQRERAKLMLPTLACFLLGSIVSGPIADWVRSGPHRLARWRWRLVIVGRAVETLALGSLIVGIAAGPPTIARVLPYWMVTAFMKTALRSTRFAFEVDLLRHEDAQLGQDGAALRDEKGDPRPYKVHLLTFSSLTSALRALSALAGLLLGGQILAAVGHVYWPLFAFDVLTNIGFIAVIAMACNPSEGETMETEAVASPHRPSVLVTFGRSLLEGVRFLAGREQRPLVALLVMAWMTEVVTEAYDGKMIVKHILGGSDDLVRHADIAWTVVSIAALVALPALARKVGSLGKIMLVAMALDGVVVAVAGRLAGFGTVSIVLPFTIALGCDRGLTLGASTLAELAMNSASSAAMRGRVAGTYAFFVIIGDVVMEVVATGLSEWLGIPAMIVRIGLFQIGLVAVIALVGGKRLWTFGLVTRVAPLVG